MSESELVRSAADILAEAARPRIEIPVQFFPISPERVKRTSVLEGLQSLATLVAGRFAPSRSRRAGTSAAATPASQADERRTTPVVSR